MKIKTLKLSLILLALTVVFVSCNDDDGVTEFVPEDRTEQQVLDDANILAYLDTHYYNSSFFETGADHRYSDIILTELEAGEAVPDDHTLLMNAVETRTTTYLDADYTYYVLNINLGGGEYPKFTDAIRVRYEGSSINEEVGEDEAVFDSSITPIDLNLQTNGSTISGTIKAWQLVLPTFKTAINYEIGENGNVDFYNFGLGVMFVPSGLGYFSGSSTGKAYDDLIFKFELLQHEVVDHDGDGVPSYLEDIDGDLDVTNDDTDEDSSPNFIDTNDDGDDVLTIDELIPGTRLVGETFDANEFEISRSMVNGVMTIKTVTIADHNNDGTPDYLDPNRQFNYNVSE